MISLLSIAMFVYGIFLVRKKGVEKEFLAESSEKLEDLEKRIRPLLVRQMHLGMLTLLGLYVLVALSYWLLSYLCVIGIDGEYIVQQPHFISSILFAFPLTLLLFFLFGFDRVDNKVFANNREDYLQLYYLKAKQRSKYFGRNVSYFFVLLSVIGFYSHFSQYAYFDKEVFTFKQEQHFFFQKKSWDDLKSVQLLETTTNTPRPYYLITFSDDVCWDSDGMRGNKQRVARLLDFLEKEKGIKIN